MKCMKLPFSRQLEEAQHDKTPISVCVTSVVRLIQVVHRAKKRHDLWVIQDISPKLANFSRMAEKEPDKNPFTRRKSSSRNLLRSQKAAFEDKSPLSRSQSRMEILVMNQIVLESWVEGVFEICCLKRIYSYQVLCTYKNETNKKKSKWKYEKWKEQQGTGKGWNE